VVPVVQIPVAVAVVAHLVAGVQKVAAQVAQVS
jgi:hypothetical protein